jgi:phospholipid/cholesterol/gamma-HCH transport system substrate-binding protein
MRRVSLPFRSRAHPEADPGTGGDVGSNGRVASRSQAVGEGAPRRSERGSIKFRERNLKTIAIVTALVLVAAVLVSLNLSRIPFLSRTRTYHAMFANAGGLATGDIVTVAGVRVGTVTALTLDHAQVEVTFTISDGVHLGSQTSANMKVLTPIGQEFLELAPAGPGHLSGAIPQSRTTIPETLVSDLSTLSTETGKINIPQLEKSLDATSGTIKGIPATTVASALGGLARLSSIIASRQQDLSALVTSASSLAGVLATNDAQIVNLVGQGDLVLKVLEQRRADITALLVTTSSLGQELSSLLTNNRSQLITLLTNLRTVSAILAHDSGDLGAAIPLLEAFSRYSANATGSGPFADFTLPTLLIPDNVIAQCAKLTLSDKLRGCRV